MTAHGYSGPPCLAGFFSPGARTHFLECQVLGFLIV